MTSLVRCILQTYRALALTILILGGRELNAEAVLLDGTNDHIAIGHDSALATEHFTIETWFKRAAGGTTVYVNTTHSYPLVTRGNAANFFLGTDTSGRLHGEVMIPTLSRISVLAPSAVPENQWHHGAFTYDGTKLRLFLDGAMVMEEPLNTPPSVLPQGTRLGQITYEGNPYGSWSGRMDETRIWNRALSEAEIAKHRFEAITFAPGLLARWGFDGTADPVTNSDGANAISATLTNGASYSPDSPPLQGLQPTTTITGPAAPIEITPGTALDFTATATDEDDAVVAVEFYANHEKVGEDVSAPYELNWTPATTGIHLIRAVAVDAAGHRNGSSSAATVAVLPSIGNESTYLDGVNAYGNAGANTNHALTTFTVEARFFMDGDGTPALVSDAFAPIGPCVGLVSRANNGAVFNYLLGIRTTDNVLIGGFGGVKTLISGHTAITRGVWHHAAASFDGDVIRLYLNGQLEAESLVTTDPSSTQPQLLSVGSVTTSIWNGVPTFSGNFHGALDEVRIWDHSRSTGAIHGTRNSNITTAAGLVVRWSMDPTFGPILFGSGNVPADIVLSPRWVRSGGPTVNLGTPPAVALTSPTSGVSLNRDQAFVLRATATAAGSNIARVEFWSESQKLGEANNAPYELNWNAAPVGVHTLIAMAFAENGGVGVSPPVTVNVTPASGSGGIYLAGNTSTGEAGFSQTERFTFECWFRREGPAISNPLAVNSTLSAQALIRFGSFSGGLAAIGIVPGEETLVCVFGNAGNIQALKGTTKLQLGDWYHVALSYDGSAVRLFLNGVMELQGIAAKPDLGLFPSIRLGIGDGSQSARFNGHIDEVRLWDYDRSLTEIAGSRFQRFETHPGLRARWTFNEGTGPYAASTGSEPQILSVPETGWTTGYTPLSMGPPPSIAISSPTPNSTFPILAPFTVTANASDADGSVQKVEFYIGTNKVGEDTTSPYQMDVTGSEIGVEIVRVVAIDNQSLTTTARIPINLNPPLGGEGLYFDGVDDVVQLGSNPHLALEQFTIEAWVRRDGEGIASSHLAGSAPIIARGHTAGRLNYVLGIQLQTGRPVAAMKTTSGSTIISAIGTNSIPIAEWHHLAATFDGTALRLYVQGIEVANITTASVPHSDAALPTRIGGFSFEGGEPVAAFHGYIDEVRIWDHARSGPAISADRWRTSFSDPTLIARWALNEGTGTQINSSQTTAVPGTIVGARWTVGRPDAPNPIPSSSVQISATPVIGETVNLGVTHEPGAQIILVEAFINGLKSGESTNPPWSLPFSPLTPGRYIITIVSTTADGSKSASNDLVVDVTPAPNVGALYFDGVDDHVELPSREELSLSSFTAEAWFRREGPGRAGVALLSGSFTPILSAGFQFGLTDITQKFILVAPVSPLGTKQVVGPTTIEQGVWYHVAVTGSGDEAKIYLNGQLEASISHSGTISRVAVTNPSLGTSLDNNATRRGAFHGYMDEVRIWSVARTPEEIAANYQKELYSLPWLVARWGFQESAGGTAFDSSSSALNGILRNNPTRTAGVSLATNSPPTVTLQAPAANAEMNSPVGLSAVVNGDPVESLTSAFHGREIARDADEFTIAILPSLANYTIPANGGSPATLEAMLDWVVSNRVEKKIVFVGQTGAPASITSANGWATLSQAITRLENPQTTGLPAGIPYGIVPDFGALPYTQYFDANRFQNRAWYGSLSPFNYAVFFRAGGVDMGAVILRSSFDTNWLRTLLQTQPNRQFIVLVDDVDNASSATVTIKDFSNVALLLGGKGLGEKRSIISNGSRVYHSISANFEDRSNGGDGWMRLLTFHPTKGRIHVRTFSPTRNEFESDGNSDFTVGWNAPLASTPNSLISSASHSSGDTASAIYTATSPGRRYEWHAEVSDGTTVRLAASREFTTALSGPGVPPTVAITSPTTSLTVPLPVVVRIAGTASSSESSIERTELIVDGLALDSDSIAPYQFLWSPGSSGTYQVAIAAVDRRGLRSVSAPVQIVVGASTGLPLSASITSPSSSTTLYDTGIFPIQATTTGTAPVSGVDFYVDGVLIGSDDVAPYSVNWAYSGLGIHTLQVLARSSNGQSALAASSVTVSTLPSQSITRQPYLQMPTANSVTVRWRSTQIHPGRVWYGTSPLSLTSFADETTPKSEHSVRVSGLQPNTRYYYGVGSQTAIVSGGDQSSYFTTPPKPGRARSTRIWALGDFGTGAAGQLSTRDAYYNYAGTRETDLVLMLGDNAYNSGLDNEYQANVFNVYNSILRRTFTWATIGNHDTAGSTVHNPSIAYYSIFDLPTSAECGGVASGTERYYSFDHANIHFVCLDSMTTDRSPSGAMATWLRSDLEVANAGWIIAFWHHPPYSKGGWDSDTNNDQIQMRTTFVPILDEFGVDLVLSGHSHNYERSWLMSGHFGLSSSFTNAMKRSTALGRPATDGAYVKDPAVPLPDQGTIYVVAGNGGANLYPSSIAPLNHPAMAVNLRTLGTMAIDVSGNQLDVRMVQASGSSTDTFTIVKPYSTVDTDADSLPDEYETEYGLNPGNPADAIRDDDGDGFPNLFEFQAGTDPNVASSGLTTRIARGPGGRYVVYFPTNTLKFYTVERCDNLPAGQWTPLAPEAAGTGSEMAVTDSNPPFASKRCYRVKVR